MPRRPVIHPRMAARLGMVVDGALPDVASINRPGTEDDGAGGTIPSFTVVAGAIPCRLERATGSEQQVAAQVQAVTFWIITFRAGQDVQPQDQIVIGARTFEVQAIGDPQSCSAETFVRAVEIL